MNDPKIINIGGSERSVLVSQNAVSCQLDEQEKFWRGVASGSTLPSTSYETDQEALDILLKRKK